MGVFGFGGPHSIGSKAYKAHVQASQLRAKKNFTEAEIKFEEAFQLYVQYISEGGNEAKYLSAYAMLLMRKGNFEKAKDLLSSCFKASDATPDLKASIRIDYSVCLWKLGEIEKACDSIRRASQVGKSTALYATGGMILIEGAKQSQDFSVAIAFNEEAFDYDEDDAGILDNMGQLALALSEKATLEGNPEDALAQKEKAIDFEKRAHEANPTQITSAYFYAKLLCENKEYNEAQNVLKRIEGVPVTAISQISPEMLATLRKEYKL